MTRPSHASAPRRRAPGARLRLRAAARGRWPVAILCLLCGSLTAARAEVGTEPPDAAEPTGSLEGVMEFGAFDTPASRLPEWLGPLRVTLAHEASFKAESPTAVVNNRSAMRLEYSKLFDDAWFVRLDSKLNLYWGTDHRAEAKDRDVLFETITREAFVQSSFGSTSLRLGYQLLIWGVSEGGAVTDVISPRNLSEFFFVSLDESRIGQPMLTVDNFGRSGHWGFFFIPRPSYNRYPKPGTEYDIPAAFDADKPDDGWRSADFEYGLRWKQTFGKSDISLMAASLIDNDYLVRKQRFDMVGMTANVARGNLLTRAELALKRPLAFFSLPAPAADPVIVESDQLDLALGFDYTPGGRSLSFGLEFTRSRMLDWDPSIPGRERDIDALVAIVTNRFLHDDLSVTWMTIHGRPYTTYHHKLLTTYLLDDNASLQFELFYPDERDERSGSYAYRDQKQVFLKYQYQF